MMKKLFAGIRRLFSVKSVQKERLFGETKILENEVMSFDWGMHESDKEEAIEALKRAKESAIKYAPDECWGHLHYAERLLIKSMNDTQRQIRGKLLLIESEKFHSTWRQNQLKLLLGNLCSPRLHTITQDELLKAIAVRNDYYNTRSYKMNLHTVSVNILTMAMTFILLGILILSFIWEITNFLKTPAPDLPIAETKNFSKVLIISAMFGALGAGFSFAKTLFSYNLETSKIPEQILSMTVTTLRFVIGASAAIIIIMLLRSEVLKGSFSTEILDSPITYIVFSFVAGFSERWVVKMLGLVTKDNEKV